MPFRYSVAALLVGCVAVPAIAQDAQGLIAKNLEARGGEAAIAALKNVNFEGRTIFPGGFEVTYKETRARLPQGAADRVELGVQGMDITTAYDGRGGWRINPLQGRKDAETMSADEARSLADSALIEGPLLAREPAHQRQQRDALEVLHHDVELPVGLPELEHLTDVRM